MEKRIFLFVFVILISSLYFTSGIEVLRFENIYFKIHGEIKFQIEVESLDNRNIQNIIKEFIEPIDLKIWPLYRFKLYYVNDNKYIFLCDFHHSIIVLRT